MSDDERFHLLVQEYAKQLRYAAMWNDLKIELQLLYDRNRNRSTVCASYGTVQSLIYGIEQEERKRRKGGQ